MHDEALAAKLRDLGVVLEAPARRAEGDAAAEGAAAAAAAAGAVPVPVPPPAPTVPALLPAPPPPVRVTEEPVIEEASPFPPVKLEPTTIRRRS